ncbi:MAG: DUF4178 domain-containing protein [Thiotrichaceae bacterium]|nr:DUF4178 domain-containing protein [Thiotrichaceae bacterium]
MSSVNAEIRSINCTQCAAPLELHGGRKVKSISCPYCGSVLDNKDEYKVVEQFLVADRPYAPIKIGQEGVLKGVKLTIIGMIEYKTADSRGWIEYQLFSPTHGYSWLSYETGHFVFGHKVRYYPDSYSKEWQSELNVNGKKYTVIDHYKANVSFVEGELTWIAHKNDPIEVIEAIAPPYIYSIEKTKHEEEYSLGEYLTAETIYNAFGAQGEPEKTYWIHPAQPYAQGGFFGALTKSSQFFAKIYLVICLLLFIFATPERVLDTTVAVEQYQKEFVSKAFIVDKPDKALKINLISRLSMSWAFFAMEIKNVNGELVHSVGKEMYYYLKGSEKKGAQQTSLYFKVPSGGSYTLSIKGFGGNNLQPLFIDIQKGIVDSQFFWNLLWLTLFFGWIWPFFGRRRFNNKRWSDSE